MGRISLFRIDLYNTKITFLDDFFRYPIGKLYKVGDRQLLGSLSEEWVLLATEVAKYGL